MRRAVVITPLPLPDPERDKHGVFLRLAMFLQAIGRKCCAVDIVHFAKPDTLAAQSSAQDATFSAFWGTPVRTLLVPLNTEPRQLNEAARASFDVCQRGEFRPFLGREAKRALEEILARPTDLVFAHRLPAMTVLSGLEGPTPPILFDLDDVEHRVKLRAAAGSSSLLAKAESLMQVPALAMAERRAIKRAARTFVCSEHDRQLLARFGIEASRLAVVPNAVEIPNGRPALAPSPNILFIGNFGYPPNAEAAQELVTTIWPIVRARAPAARLLVTGAHPEKIPAFPEAPERVAFTGLVDDLSALYAEVRLVCCPIRNGGGTRIKLIEAAALGKPIVATSVAAEGLGFTPDIDLLIADSADGIANACLRLLSDDEEAERLAASAYAKAQGRYSLDHVRSEIGRQIRATVAETEGMGRPAAAQRMEAR
jgi:glycosyltransferase involved in cell wall biosynthesis